MLATAFRLGGDMADGTAKDNPKAEEAFLDFVEMGPGRSLEALAAKYRSCTEPVPTKQVSRLKIWSSRYGWQARLAAATSAVADAKLTEAAELDADTFLVTSRLLNERVKMTMAVDTDHVVKVRESVRKAAPKGGASVSVNVSVEVRQLAEQLAKSMGVSADELIADAEAIAAGAWGDS